MIEDIKRLLDEHIIVRRRDVFLRALMWILFGFAIRALLVPWR
jgi:hypothetical protein